VTSSRSGKGISVSLAIGVYLLYYLFLVGGEKFSDRGKLDPFLAMWAANFVLMGLGIPLFIKAARESTLLSITLKPRKADTDADADDSEAGESD
jgi:lipopolysaccharide export system permease protein